MDSILFEKQEAALCAQHALNMLLQNSLFSVAELTEIARRLDQEENSVLDQNFQNRESQNMNDSGYFSIQVISEALKSFDLTLTNIEHPTMADIKNDPLKARAFICNHMEHWFVLRKFGHQWFELNSVKMGPGLLSNTYVHVFLHQLAAEQYSIFVVNGILPDSEADQLISLCPVVEKSVPKKPKKEPGILEKLVENVGRRLGSGIEPESQEDKDLAIAMAMSMETRKLSEDNLEAAIRLSLQGNAENPEAAAENAENPVETPILTAAAQQRKDREAFLRRFEERK
ncbi:unnamed protein product [Caenorhabditis angaria]|uniref:Ataxin-3 homolog n=1 Tax=Caenorhabditis angaria TaxID=860376 RepID=A0A9P1IS67_9PELO|nr:unnamed protein product [Caenorhabditis angaria]